MTLWRRLLLATPPGPRCDKFLSLCDPLTVEILFVSLLGLHGLECLRMAVRLLPEKLDNRGNKWTYVKRILDIGGVLPSRSDNAPITSSTLMHISESLMQSTYFEQRVSFDTFSPLLNAVSSATGIAHMAFLIPPVNSCINEKCRYYGQTRSLCISHNPTTVTVFKLTGAVAGTKVCYKCWKCETNYNYAMYGNKTKDGECFYDTARDLVEISDTVYCEKQLYLLYCLLR